MRTVSLEASIARYLQGGEGFEKLVHEYLSTHVAILQCEEEIDQLKQVKAGSAVS